MEFINKLIYLLKKPFVYFVSVLMTMFDIAVNDGSVDKLAVMFLLITVMPWADFFFAVIGRVIKGYAIRSHKIGKTFLKLLAAYGVFFSLAFVLILINGVDSIVSLGIYYAIWTFVVVFVIREILSIFETAEVLGLPVPKSVKRIIDGSPNKIEQQYDNEVKKAFKDIKKEEKQDNEHIEMPIEDMEFAEDMEEQAEQRTYKYKYKTDEDVVNDVDLLYGKGGDVNG
jgi:phage-related holin